MADLLGLTDRIAQLDQELNPAELDKLLTGADADQCKAAFDTFKGTAATVLIATVICVGRAIEAGQKGDGAAESIGELFDIGPQFARKLARVYRDIVRVRLEEQGANAVFPLDEITFYLVSAESAPKLQKPAIELLQHAEEEKTANRTYSVRDFKDWISDQQSDEGSTTSEDKKVDRIFGKVAALEDDVIDEWVAHCDLREKLQRIEDAYSAADRALQRAKARLEEERNGTKG